MTNLTSDFSKIEPHHFFSNQDEKTHLNWFTFELACEISQAIPYQTKKYLSKHGYTRQKFNKSCIRLAFLLQDIVLKKLRNEIPEMQFGYIEVEKAFPELKDKIVNKLLDSTEKAWNNLLNTCISCPSACVTNKNKLCPMFDDKSYYT